MLYSPGFARRFRRQTHWAAVPRQHTLHHLHPPFLAGTSVLKAPWRSSMPTQLPCLCWHSSVQQVPQQLPAAQAVVADAAARTRDLLASSETLASLQRSAVHAFALYRKTRPQAAPQSALRAKALPLEGMHPLLAAQVPETAMAGLEAQVGAPQQSALRRVYGSACVPLQQAHPLLAAQVPETAMAGL